MFDIKKFSNIFHDCIAKMSTSVRQVDLWVFGRPTKPLVDEFDGSTASGVSCGWDCNDIIGKAIHHGKDVPMVAGGDRERANKVNVNNFIWF